MLLVFSVLFHINKETVTFDDMRTRLILFSFFWCDSDFEAQQREAVKKSPGRTCEKVQGGSVGVHGGGVPAVPEGILWQDCGGKEMTPTLRGNIKKLIKKGRKPRRKQPDCVVWIKVDFSVRLY